MFTNLVRMQVFCYVFYFNANISSPEDQDHFTVAFLNQVREVNFAYKLFFFVRDRVQQNFRGSKNPYGEPWAAITHRSGQPLIDTSRLRSSITFDVQGNDLKIGTPVHYARYHQIGTEHIKQRAFLPTRDLGLPAQWLADAVTEINEQIRRAFA